MKWVNKRGFIISKDFKTQNKYLKGNILTDIVATFVKFHSFTEGQILTIFHQDTEKKQCWVFFLTQA